MTPLMKPVAYNFLKTNISDAFSIKAGVMAPLVEFGPVKRQLRFLFHEVYSAVIKVNRNMIRELYS